jgi:hypothetical protein
MNGVGKRERALSGGWKRREVWVLGVSGQNPATFCLTLGSGAPLQDRLPSRTRPLRGSRAGPLEDPGGP